MTVGREFLVEATTGEIRIFCAQLIMLRCPLCMNMYTDPVMREHLVNHHNLVVK